VRDNPKIAATYAATPMQMGMLFHSAAEKGRGVYSLQVVCSLREEVLFDLLQSALRYVIRQHEALRTTFSFPSGSDPVQEVWKEVEVKIETSDLRNLEASIREQRLNEFVIRSRDEWINPCCMPLMRFALIRMTDSESRFIWILPHALLDRSGVAIVVKQLLDTYDALRNGEQPRQSPPSGSFSSYVQCETAQDFFVSKNHWQATFESFVPALAYSNSGRKGAWKEQELVLPETLAETLEKMAEDNGCTLNTILQAVWSVTRGINAADPDIAFGITRSCRSRFAHGDSVVGLCMNTLPLRIKFRGGDSFVALLQRIRRQVLALRSFESTPLAAIQSWVGGRNRYTFIQYVNGI